MFRHWRALTVVVVLSMGCADALESPGTGSIVLEVALQGDTSHAAGAPSAAQSLATISARLGYDAVRACAEGPTNRCLDLQLAGDTWGGTLDALTPGSYCATVEARVAGSLEHSGRTCGIDVLAGETARGTVTLQAVRPSPAHSTLTVTQTAIAACSSGCMVGLTASTVTVVARNQFGEAVRSVVVTISSDGSSNAFTPSAAGTTDASGAYSAVFSSTVAASKIISATVGGVGLTQTATVTVNPSAATQMALDAGSNQSATVNTAVAVRPSVIVRDQFNNPVSGVVVGFNVTAGGGSATGLSQTTGSNGIATVGSWTVGTTSGANNNSLMASSDGLAGSPVTFTASATAGAASRLAFMVGPTDNFAGATIAPAVEVIARDQFGNTAAGFVGNVSVAIGVNPSGDTLSGTKSRTAIGGVATFDDLTIDYAGIGYTLTTNAPNVTGATSGSFAVINPIPSLDSLSPLSRAPFGWPDIELSVVGKGFVRTSIVLWNGEPRVTTFWNRSVLSAAILASDLATPGTARVSVINPSPGGGGSDTLDFTVIGLPTIDLRANGTRGDITVSDGSTVDLTWTVLSPNSPVACRGEDGFDLSDPLVPSWVGSKGSGIDTLTGFERRGPLSGPAAFGYVLACANEAGTAGYSLQVQVLAPPPAAPMSLTARAVSSTEIELTWTDNSTNEDGFRIERCQGGGCANFAEFTTVGANVTSYQSTGLIPATTYSYRVRAYNIAGFSGYSDTASATTDMVGFAWSQLAPAAQERTPAVGHAAVYRSSTERMIVFGGTTDGFDMTNDVWVLNLPGNSWELAQPDTLVPMGRLLHSAVIQPATNRIVVFSGFLTNEDVWVLSEADNSGFPIQWHRSRSAGTAPAPRWAHSAVYDTALNRMIVFGGNVVGGTVNDVWILENADSTTGAPRWIQVLPSGLPPTPRSYHTAVYDHSANTMTISGGEAAGSKLDEVWILTNANGLGAAGPQWIQVLPGSGPGPRSRHTAVYDAATREMIVFGGATPAGTVNDAWVLTNASTPAGPHLWIRIEAVGGGPSPRVLHTAVYDAATGRMIVFGGDDGVPKNDTWILSRAGGLSAIGR